MATKFDFLTPAKLLDKNYESNSDVAPHEDDIDKDEFEIERVRLRAIISSTGKTNELANKSPLELLKYILQFRLEVSLPNITIMLRLFLTIAISNAGCERSFSKLKLIKNYLRSTMSTLRLSNLGIMAIEQEITETIDTERIIRDFALMKSRKIKF